MDDCSFWFGGWGVVSLEVGVGQDFSVTGTVDVDFVPFSLLLAVVVLVLFMVPGS